jgi:RHS repeat-associated protein
VTAPEGLRTSFGYDPATRELTSVTLPEGGVIRYEHADHAFPLGPGVSEPSRVVKARVVEYTDNFGEARAERWEYAYEEGNATRRTTPEGHVTEFESYGWADGAWRMGLPRAERWHDDGGGTSRLAERSFVFGAYGYAADGAERALLVEETRTLEGTTGDATARRTLSYPCVGDRLACPTYADYGQPDRVHEYDHDGSLGRTWVLDYDRSSALLGRNIVGQLAERKLVGRDGSVASRTSYARYTTPSLLGLLWRVERHYDTLGRDSAGGVATATYEYDGHGNVERRTVDRWPNPAGLLVTSYAHENGRMSRMWWQDDPQQVEVRRGIDFATGAVLSVTDANDQEWTYPRDGLNRVVGLVVPGGYDDTAYAYGAGNRYRETTSGSTYRRSERDGLGRTAWTRTLVEGRQPEPLYSYVKSGYDRDGRVTRVYEPSAAEPEAGSAHTLLVYDGLGRVVRSEGVGTPDGVTTWTWSGAEVTVRPPLGPSRLERYDAWGNLVSVSEPGGGTTRYGYDGRGELEAVTPPPPGRERSWQRNQLGQVVVETTPEGGVTEYRWDPVGNLLDREDADGTETVWSWDGRNRLTGVEYRQGGQVSRKVLVWDGSGTVNGRNRLAQVAWPEEQATIDYLEYDEHGRVRRKRETVRGVTAETAYDYNAQGLVRVVSYPHPPGEAPLAEVEYGYTESNQVKWVKRNGSNLVTEVRHGAAFGPEELWFAGGRVVKWDAKESSGWRPKRIWAEGGQGTRLDLVYQWDVDGTLDQVTTNGRVDDFGYDDWRRLKSVQYGAGANDRVDYAYDGWGNLLARTTPSWSWNALPGFEFTQAVDERNRIVGLPYTASGKMLGDGRGLTFVPGAEGQLQEVREGSGLGTKRTRYGYNGLDRRVWREESTLVGGVSVEEYVFHDEAGEELAVWRRANGTGPAVPHLEVVRGDGGAVLATVEHGAEPKTEPPRYVLGWMSDHLGSARQLTLLARSGQPDGRTWRTVEYFPYGYPKSVVDEVALTPEPDVRYGFQGKPREGSGPLQFFGARYYHDGIARWLTVDPVDDADVSHPHTWNRYAFVHGNPLSYVDPDGRGVDDPVEPFDVPGR